MALDIQVPEWLNITFIQKCLQDGEKTKLIEVFKFEVSSAVPPGNNFTSCLWRVQVDYKSNGNSSLQSFIVKAPLTDNPLKEFHDQFFLTEPCFYQKYLPKAYAILSNHQFFPKSYFTGCENVIVLEDLKASGYQMADRCKQLDYDHCKLYAVSAATMHAVSIAVHNKEPNLVEQLGISKGFSNDSKSVPIKMLVEKGLNFFSEKIKSISECSKYAEVPDNLLLCIWDLLVKLNEPNDTLNTLNQGDPWTANMMFRYDSSGKVNEIKLLDFQALQYASPLLDIVFFIWTSANDDVRENSLEEFYHLYCNTLNARLEEFNCSERLTYDQLQKHMQIFSPYIIVVSSCFYPFMTNKEPLDMATLMTEVVEGKSNLISEYYNEEFCEVKLPRLVKQLNSVGVFDYLKSYLH